MSSYTIKTNLINYLRFKKNIGYIATECGNNNSDILYIDGKHLYEIEIKTSYQDFLADFKKKKHKLYAETFQLNVTERPKYFSFAVTDNIFEKCKIYLDKKELFQYGLLKVSTTEYDEKELIEICRCSPQLLLTWHRKPSELHDKEMCYMVKRKISLRMASELATLRAKISRKGL